MIDQSNQRYSTRNCSNVCNSLKICFIQNQKYLFKLIALFVCLLFVILLLFFVVRFKRCILQHWVNCFDFPIYLSIFCLLYLSIFLFRFLTSSIYFSLEYLLDWHRAYMNWDKWILRIETKNANRVSFIHCIRSISSTLAIILNEFQRSFFMSALFSLSSDFHHGFHHPREFQIISATVHSYYNIGVYIFTTSANMSLKIKIAFFQLLSSPSHSPSFSPSLFAVNITAFLLIFWFYPSRFRFSWYLLNHGLTSYSKHNPIFMFD